MSEQSSRIEALADSYADSLYEGDAERLRVIFDPICDLRWSEKGQLQTLSVVEWLKRVGLATWILGRLEPGRPAPRERPAGSSRPLQACGAKRAG
jgi:putative lumazine-binding protein